MMDGPLRPNALLDAARVALALPDVDNLTLHRAALVCSSGQEICCVSPRESARPRSRSVALSSAGELHRRADPDGSLAVGLDGHGVLIVEGPHAGRMINAAGGRGLTCPTAALFLDADRLVVASGVGDHDRRRLETRPHGARRERGVWPIDLPRRCRRRSCSPKALLSQAALRRACDGRLLVSESLAASACVALDLREAARPSRSLSDLPAYPGRIARAHDGGFWLALFAPRNQLVEFVLREDDYRRRMIDDSRSGLLDCAGAVERRELPRADPGRGAQEAQHAEALVAELVLRAGRPLQTTAMRPLASFHSRADGAVHGVTVAAARSARRSTSPQGARAASSRSTARPKGSARR